MEVSVNINWALFPILNRAEKDSKIPTIIANRICTDKNIKMEINIEKVPVKKLAIRAPYIANFRFVPYRIKPKSKPLLSRIITSCTIVNSKCVLGSSTGIRLFSIIAIIINTKEIGRAHV